MTKAVFDTPLHWSAANAALQWSVVNGMLPGGPKPALWEGKWQLPFPFLGCRRGPAREKACHFSGNSSRPPEKWKWKANTINDHFMFYYHFFLFIFAVMIFNNSHPGAVAGDLLLIHSLKRISN